MKKVIAIGCDHAATAYKNSIVHVLTQKGYEVHDKGTHSEESVDYPDYAHPVALEVEKGIAEKGILLCGSANGVCITANKHQAVRAALCWKNEIAALARHHNDANIICLPARFTTLDECLEMVDTFLNTEFEGGRHQNRVNKIACC